MEKEDIKTEDIKTTEQSNSTQQEVSDKFITNSMEGLTIE